MSTPSHVFIAVPVEHVAHLRQTLHEQLAGDHEQALILDRDGPDVLAPPTLGDPSMVADRIVAMEAVAAQLPGGLLGVPDFVPE